MRMWAFQTQQKPSVTQVRHIADKHYLLADDFKGTDSYINKCIDRLDYYQKLELVERRKSFVQSGKRSVGSEIKKRGTLQRHFGNFAQKINQKKKIPPQF